MRHARGFGRLPTAILAVLFVALCPSASALSADDNGLELVLQTGHSSMIRSVAMSADGKYVLSGSIDKTAILWDAATGRLLRTFRHADGISSVAISADGKLAVTASVDKTAVVWDVVTGRKLKVIDAGKYPFSAVAITPDGKRLFAGGQSTIAELWDTTTGERLQSFEGHTKQIRSVALSADGQRALTGAMDNSAIVWDATTGKKLHVLGGRNGYLTGSALSGDGKLALSGCTDNSTVLWDTTTGETLRTLKQSGSVALSRDGKIALTTSTLWDTAKGEQLQTFKGPTAILVAAMTPDGKHAVTGMQDATMVLWDGGTGRQESKFAGALQTIQTVAIPSGDEATLITASYRQVTFWDTVNGRPARRFACEPLGFSGDGKRFVTAADKSAELRDAANGESLRQFKGFKARIWSASLSADGTRLVTATDEDPTILWDGESGEQLQSFKGKPPFTSTAISPDGKRVLTAAEGDVAILWDAATGGQLQVFKSPARRIGRVPLALNSNGGRALASGPDRNSMALWDADKGELLQTLSGHTAWINAAIFSSDGKSCLTGSDDDTAILWDTSSGKPRQTFKGHTASVRSVALGRDGKRVLTGALDATARLWDAATGSELCVLMSFDKSDDWLVITPEGLFDGSAGGRQKVSYRVGSGLNVVPVDRFFQDFYRPGLLAAIIKGEKPRPDKGFRISNPPTVRIVSPKEGGTVEEREIVLETEINDEGGGIQGPWLYLNGARLLADARKTKDGNKIKGTFKVSLVEGDNRLEVRGANADGSWASEPALITLRLEKPLDKPVLHLVTIGISKYAQESYRLKYAGDDARAIADLFENRGKALYRDVKVTRDLIDEGASQDKIRETLTRVPKEAKAQDTLVLFLAGHGAMVGQRYYFLPYSFECHKDKKLEDDIREQGLPADELADFLSAGPALKRILILDTCASGGAVDLFKVAARNPFAFRGEIERLSRSQGICILAASSASEEAKEPDALRHGVLTYALLAGMKAVHNGPLENKGLELTGKDETVDVLDWFSYAESHVRRLTKEYCGQEQNVHMGMRGTSFPVLPLK